MNFPQYIKLKYITKERCLTMIEISRNMNEGALDTLAIAGLSLATGYALVSTGKLIHDTVKRKKYIKIA